VDSVSKLGLDASTYPYLTSAGTAAHEYLLPTVITLAREAIASRREASVFDLGCGNGAAGARVAAALGVKVVGVDLSQDGIRVARNAHPHLAFDVRSVYDDLATEYGRFPVVISLEVVEHLYSPRKYSQRLFELLEPKGTVIVSTPYHGYAKNLALAITGKMDAHFSALWDNGHIKFWSERTLRLLLEETGFVDIRFHRVGRVKALAKSMIATATRA
jgi:2-polyprenyl-6-hydroxyphenyl methylase/3-demethylubiquinone-9 3-methyltransferase